MRSAHTVRFALGILAVMLMPGLLVAVAWAQAPTAPGPSVTPPAAPTSPPSTGGSGAGPILVILVLAVLGIVAIGKMVDLKRKREAEALHLQAQISDALLRERTLFDLPVTPTAHVPFWSGSPATIEVSGRVPTPEMRQAVLRIVGQEASRIRSDFRIDDRLAVVPSVATRAA